MRRASLTALFLIALCALLTACSGAPDTAGPVGVPAPAVEQEQIPTAGNGITDVGSPVEEPDVPAGGSDDCSYGNTKHGFLFFCPDGWRITAFDETQVSFASDAGVDLDLSFIDLKAGESLQSFLTQVRGNSEGLQEVEAPGFSEVLCAPEEVVDDEAGLFIVECYYSGLYEGLHFVLVESGIVDRELELGIVGGESWKVVAPSALQRRDAVTAPAARVLRPAVLKDIVIQK